MTISRTFDHRADSVRAARDFVRTQIADLHEDLAERITLMVSELATNSVRHAATDFTVAIRRTARQIRVQVRDRGAGVPVMQTPAPDEPTGRGLRIIDRLANEWGIRRSTRGWHVVWFTVRIPDVISAMVGAGAEAKAATDQARAAKREERREQRSSWFDSAPPRGLRGA